MKKRVKLTTWKQSAKKTSITNGDKVVELLEDRIFFAGMFIVARYRPEILLQETLGMYELAVVPRSLLSIDGSMVHASCKSQLMKMLESIIKTEQDQHITFESSPRGTAVVDGMVEVQNFFKPHWVKTCGGLTETFCSVLIEKA